MGQQLALTGELGRLYPSKELKIFGFAKIKGGNTTKLKQDKQKEQKQKRKSDGAGEAVSLLARGITRKSRGEPHHASDAHT